MWSVLISKTKALSVKGQLASCTEQSRASTCTKAYVGNVHLKSQRERRHFALFTWHLLALPLALPKLSTHFLLSTDWMSRRRMEKKAPNEQLQARRRRGIRGSQQKAGRDNSISLKGEGGGGNIVNGCSVRTEIDEELFVQRWGHMRWIKETAGLRQNIAMAIDGIITCHGT